MVTRPQSDEYAPFYAGYIERVPDDTDVFDMLSQQPGGLRHLLRNTPDSEASFRPAPGEWSIKEVLGHLLDTERIFSYRALRISRGDTTPMNGFEQDEYVRATDFNARLMKDLLDEFKMRRRANVLSFKPLPEEELARRGVANNAEITVRALLYAMAGHVAHHMESLRDVYNVSGEIPAV